MPGLRRPAEFRSLQHDAANRAIVTVRVKIARVTRVRTVAEFLETGEVLPPLRQLGMNKTPGYRLGRPRALAS